MIISHVNLMDALFGRKLAVAWSLIVIQGRSQLSFDFLMTSVTFSFVVSFVGGTFAVGWLFHCFLLFMLFLLGSGRWPSFEERNV